jgi:hypothetical protein
MQGFYFLVDPLLAYSIENETLNAGIVVHDYNPSTKEAEAEGSQVQVQGQTELHSKIPLQKQEIKVGAGTLKPSTIIVDLPVPPLLLVFTFWILGICYWVHICL